MLLRLLMLSMLAAFVLMPVVASADDNVRLQELFEADQDARRNPDMSWDEIDAIDEKNRSEVFSMLANGDIKTGLDYFHAAVIMQHGGDTEYIRLAHSFATISAQLGFERATWLQAASWDRLLMYFEQPQWYGTQFRVGDEGEWRLHDVQPGAVTDEQRTKWGVPSLAESKERASQRNQD